MKKYKLAIFDMDGTILNTLEDLWSATNYTLTEMNCPTRTIDEVRKFVGNGILKLLERAMPEGTPNDQIEKAFGIFMDYYNVHCMDTTRPYDGITDLLKSLRANGVKTAVVSNKRNEAVKTLCDDFFDGLFDVFVGEMTGVPKKPDRAMVDIVIDKLQMDRSDAVYIGDSDVDLMTAINSEMDHILVTWGFRDEIFLREAGASVFANTTDEVKAMIL